MLIADGDNLIKKALAEYSDLTKVYADDGTLRSADKLLTQAKNDGWLSLTEDEIKKCFAYIYDFACLNTLNQAFIDQQKLVEMQQLLLMQEEANKASAKLEALTSAQTVQKSITFENDMSYLMSAHPKEVADNE